MTNPEQRLSRVKERLGTLAKNYKDVFGEELDPAPLIEKLKARILKDKDDLMEDLLSYKFRGATYGFSTEDCLMAIKFLEGFKRGRGKGNA